MTKRTEGKDFARKDDDKQMKFIRMIFHNIAVLNHQNNRFEFKANQHHQKNRSSP